MSSVSRTTLGGLSRRRVITTGAAAVAAACTSGAARRRDPPNDIRFHGARVYVADLDAAEAFYAGALGFGVERRDGAARTLTLAATPAVHLSACDGPAMLEPGRHAQANVVLQTAEIVPTRNRMLEANVAFLDAEPRINGVGLSMRFRDPFGTALSLLEQQVFQDDPEVEPAIYNMGYHHADVARARRLYVDALGFPVRSERYFPPALPLNQRDGGFGFMLHEAAALEPAPAWREAGAAGTVMMFTTTDLAGTRAAAEAAGARVSAELPADAVFGAGFEFTDVEGLVSEVRPA